MSIYRKNKKWKAEVWFNQKRVAARAGFATKHEAEKWHNINLAKYQSGQGVSCKQNQTFDELLAHFEKLHFPKVSENSRLRYTMEIRCRIQPYFCHMPLKSITHLEVESFRASIMGNLSPKSVNCCTSLLRSIFRSAVKWRMLERTPYEMEALKTPTEKYSWWERKEYIQKFLVHAKETRYYAAYLLALECGLRQGEIIGLSKKDVDLKRCQIHIHRQWLANLHHFGPTKGRRERFVRFDPSSRLKTALAEAMLSSSHPELVFTNEAGTVLNSQKFSDRYFKSLVRESGVPRIRFHDMRHTFASWYMIEVGDIWSLKEILGHSDIKTTQRYAHLGSFHQRVARFDWGTSSEGSRPIHAQNDRSSENLLVVQ